MKRKMRFEAVPVKEVLKLKKVVERAEKVRGTPTQKAEPYAVPVRDSQPTGVSR